MSVLSEALAAKDKGTPGPWKYCGCGSCQLVWGDGLLIHDQPDGGCEAPVPCNSTGINNAIIIAAAPDALAWIKEALPYITEYRDALATNLENCDFGPREEGAARKELARLDALIARAKPEEVGR